MSQANFNSLNNNVQAQAPAKRGAGTQGSTAVATAIPTPGQGIVDQATTTQATHNGGYVAHTIAAIAPSGAVNTYGK